jgi:hypothetical protein
MKIKTKHSKNSTTIHTSCGDVIILDVNGEVRVEVIPARTHELTVIDQGFDIKKKIKEKKRGRS